MLGMAAAACAVTVGDLALRVMLRRRRDLRLASLGRFGCIRAVPGRLWLLRGGDHLSDRLGRSRGSRAARLAWLWIVWVVAAAALLAAAAPHPPMRLASALVIGGSLTNAIEVSWRGGVTDYVCLRFWPAFNLADAALVAGGVALIGRLWSVAA